jgi:hypothetical protein
MNHLTQTHCIPMLIYTPAHYSLERVNRALALLDIELRMTGAGIEGRTQDDWDHVRSYPPPRPLRWRTA